MATAPITADGPLPSPATIALEQVMADPRTARRLAEHALQQARRAHDADEWSTAERALGLAELQLRNGDEALAHLRRAVQVARRHHLTTRDGEARMSLALALDEVGQVRLALSEIARALDTLDGLPAARAQMQQALLFDRLGRQEPAMAGYSAALATFRRAGDRVWQARTLNNRGVLHAYRGALRQAETDLREAETIYLGLGHREAEAEVQHNRGFVAARAGDLPTALAHYDRADEYFRQIGRPAIALFDRAEVLLAARLFPEARQMAEAAVTAAAGSGLGWQLGQAQLLQAEIALATADMPAATAAARLAQSTFRRQARPRWTALAQYAVVRGSRPLDRPSAAALRSLHTVAARLAEAGWPEHAMETYLLAARVSLALDRKTAARTDLDRAVALRRKNVTAESRIRRAHATALLRLADGDRAGARRALTGGIRVAEAYQATFGATELRVHASGVAHDVARLGLQLAMTGGRPRDVFAWSERRRAAALRLPPVRPSHDDALAGDLAELRRISAELAAPGRPAQLATLLRHRQQLEESVRRRTRQAIGDGGTATPDPLEALTTLDGRALVELIALDGRLAAVVAAGRSVRLVELAALSHIDSELTAARFALRRMVLGQSSAATRAAAAASLRHAGDRLDELVLGPLHRHIGDRPLVVVPTGALHAMPWALLPSCRGRPVSVAPSAVLWHRAAGRPPATGPTLLVAGPGLAEADAEITDLAALMPGATTLRGRQSTADRALAAMTGASVAHIAAHAVFRGDSPQFSQLRLFDGPVTVYELERLTDPPHLLVFSACDAGQSAVHPGDELVGPAAAILGLGTTAVVAGLGPVADAVSRTLMVDFHRRRVAGAGVATALAGAQEAAAADGTDAAIATAAQFICLGAG